MPPLIAHIEYTAPADTQHIYIHPGAFNPDAPLQGVILRVNEQEYTLQDAPSDIYNEVWATKGYKQQSP